MELTLKRTRPFRKKSFFINGSTRNSVGTRCFFRRNLQFPSKSGLYRFSQDLEVVNSVSVKNIFNKFPNARLKELARKGKTPSMILLSRETNWNLYESCPKCHLEVGDTWLLTFFFDGKYEENINVISSSFVACCNIMKCWNISKCRYMYNRVPDNVF